MTEVQDHPNINRNIHPPVILLVHLLAAFLLNWLIPLSFEFSKALEWTGYILVFGGLGFAVSAVRRFGRMHTTLDPHGSVSAIVTS
jgi:protein-S-isoprenylcysteine O-methyltransferase Ste14